MVPAEDYAKTIDVHFKEAALKYPDNVALVGVNYSLTYKELDEQTDRLAAFLRVEYGARPESVVGIFMERCEASPNHPRTIRKTSVKHP